MATITLVSGILDAKRRIADITANAGRALLHSQFPNDFEYYLCSIELVDALDENKVLDYLVFPIMPSNISITNTKLKTVTKTSSGTVILENNTFIPIDINISGNFGRRLKTLASKSDFAPNAVTNNNVSKSLSKIGNSSLTLPEFSETIKTGYGALKILERIYDKASTLSSDRPVLMYFYCFAFNTHYLVEPMNLVINQSEGENMIWQYNLQLKGVAPASEVKSSDKYKSSISNYLSQSVINKGIQSAIDFASDQKSILSNQLRQKIGDAIQIDENLNRTPQIIKTIALP